MIIDRVENKKIKSCVLISHVVPYPIRAGNEIRIAKFISWLKECGWKVILLLNTVDVNEHQKALLSEKVDKYYLLDEKINEKFRRVKTGAYLIKYYINNLSNSKIIFGKKVKKYFHNNLMIGKTREICRIFSPEIVIGEYLFTSPLFDFIPKQTLRIIDTHDVFFRKKKLVVDYGIIDPLACSPVEEKQYLDKADIIIAIQDYEREVLEKLCPEKKVITVGIDFEVSNYENCCYNNVRAKGDLILLIVASDNPINVHGIDEFVKNSWSKIQGKIDNVKLRIVGKAGLKLKKSDERVQITGAVESLEEEYRNAYLVLNPVVGGTGLKIKSIEALANSMPLITMKNGAEGIKKLNQLPLEVANNWKDFTKKVIELLLDPQKRDKLAISAHEYALIYLNKDYVYKDIKAILDRI